MNPDRRVTDKQHGLSLRSGLRAGLDCIKNQKGKLIRYSCGDTNCVFEIGSPSFECKTSHPSDYLTGSGLTNMRQIIANDNGVPTWEVNFG